ncbi:hypothetical protein B6N60_03603 [Richelia sinica FACHB-800]|uniref:Uncharacterized protein n=1 Tax=Richelia sinica FACHB-800 TaxID=1357546 RepID=A0A975TBC3_9NOST|nr:hypothetical protein [Richelia sinica]MBD2663998.1 hypothetical protein [Richelia sinica FACHB-800]QXE24893.1 hypothetical protein B6N60_03603 [Richelia sinica FACHB-800]
MSGVQEYAYGTLREQEYAYGTLREQEYAYGTLREQEYAYGTLREQKSRINSFVSLLTLLFFLSTIK